MTTRRALIGSGTALALALALAALGTPAFAQEWVDAEVRRIDKEGARLTLKHAEIKSMDMPAMTMVFRVRDKAMLDGLNVGDRVRIQVVREAGQFLVTALRRAA
jgi:Cu/Ag efflux protein CusF